MVAPLQTGIAPQPRSSALQLTDIADALAAATVEAPRPCAILADSLVAYYAAEALLHQRQTLDWLRHLQEPYGRALTPLQRYSFLAQALDQGRLACRLLDHGVQEARCRPCSCLAQRLDRLRSLVEVLEQELRRYEPGGGAVAREVAG